MRTSALFGLAVASSVVLTPGCRRAQPVTPPQAMAPPPPTDSLRLARARADSIAAARRRDSIAAADARAARARLEGERTRARQMARTTLETPVHFDFDRSEIRPTDQTLLADKAAILVASGEVQIRIEGNTDEEGSDEYNLALGMRRAAEVRRFLIARGVDPADVTIVSNGEERRVCGESVESCWARNRRAEFVIVAGEDHIVAPEGRP